MFTDKFNSLLKEIDKDIAKGTVYMLDDNSGIEVHRTSTGRLSLDLPLGGGLPDGRIIEFYGGESSGKTTAAKLLGKKYGLSVLYSGLLFRYAAKMILKKN